MPRIGVISDTHNLLRPEAVEYLRGSDHIIHAGDICDPTVLEDLGRLAPRRFKLPVSAGEVIVKDCRVALNTTLLLPSAA